MGLNTTAQTWTAGQVVTAAQLNTEIRDAVNGIQAAWTTYTPTWSGSTTNPTIGNGTLSGRYRQVGKTIEFTIQLTFGSTTTVGSGNWSWTLPVTSNAGTNTPILGNGRLVGDLMRYVKLTSTTTIQLIDASGTVVSSGTAAWSTGNVLWIAGLYEAA